MMIKSKIPKGAEIVPTDFAIVGRTGGLVFGNIFSAFVHRFLDRKIPKSCVLIAAVGNILSVA